MLRLSPKSIAVAITMIICLFSLALCTQRSFAGQIIINAVGDIMLAGSGERIYSRKGYNYPFAAVANELQRADINIGNLEAPITRQGSEFTGKKYRFRTDTAVADALKSAGFTVLTLANNHILDYGSIGLKDTLQLLDSSAIRHTGAGENLEMARKPAIVRVGHKTIAFLSYSLTFPIEFYAQRNRAGTAPGVVSNFTEDIIKAKSKYDHVIVSFHWGTENVSKPSRYQIAAAHKAIDAGADIVIGHHPHVLQGIERYGKGIIFYSMGNFAFGCTNNNRGLSAIARITLDDKKSAAEILPLNVQNSEVSYQPRILAGKRGDEAVRYMNALSEPFGTQICSQGSRYILCK